METLRLPLEVVATTRSWPATPAQDKSTEPSLCVQGRTLKSREQRKLLDVDEYRTEQGKLRQEGQSSDWESAASTRHGGGSLQPQEILRAMAHGKVGAVQA